MTNKPSSEVQSERLLPCPFCYGSASLICAEDGHTEDPLFSVACTACTFGLPWSESSDETAAAWNRRAPIPTEDRSSQPECQFRNKWGDLCGRFHATEDHAAWAATLPMAADVIASIRPDEIAPLAREEACSRPCCTEPRSSDTNERLAETLRGVRAIVDEHAECPEVAGDDAPCSLRYELVELLVRPDPAPTAERESLRSVLRELLRLYDWRFEGDRRSPRRARRMGISAPRSR